MALIVYTREKLIHANQTKQRGRNFRILFEFSPLLLWELCTRTVRSKYTRIKKVLENAKKKTKVDVTAQETSDLHALHFLKK